MRNTEEGKVGWILLWALGVPIPILVVLYLLRGWLLLQIILPDAVMAVRPNS